MKGGMKRKKEKKKRKSISFTF